MTEIQDQAQAPQSEALLNKTLVGVMEAILPRYFRAVRRVVEQAEGTERLTLAQFRCLQAIAAQGTTLATHLAWVLGVTMPTMTSRIDGLVERGLVEREPDPQSRRQVLLRLTPAGRAVLEFYTALVDAWLHNLLAVLSAAQKRRLLAVLQDIEMLLDGSARARPEEGAAVLEE